MTPQKDLAVAATKRSILGKLFQVGSLTFMSRLLGMVRDFFVAPFIGSPSIESDAYLTAFRIPYFFRKVFEEGALSSAMVPYITKMIHDDRQKKVGGLISATILVGTGLMTLLTIMVILKPSAAISFFAPGFDVARASKAALFLAILFPSTIFLSVCAIVIAALHSMNHFFVPSLGPVLYNLVVISAVIIGSILGLRVPFLCIIVVVASTVQLVPQLIMYKQQGFTFGRLNHEAWQDFRAVMAKFIPCLAGVGVIHLNLLVDTAVGSYLPQGQLTIMFNAFQFLNVPLSVFGVTAFVTLLPHFSRVALYAKKRLQFYLLEVSKVMTWISVPTAFFMAWHARTLFGLLFATRATPEQLTLAATVLTVLATGLPILCMTRSLTKMFYSLGDTITPTWIVMGSTGFKIMGNIFCVAVIGGIRGVVVVTVLGGILQVVMSLYLLWQKHQFAMTFWRFGQFLWQYGKQLCIALPLFMTADLGMLMLLRRCINIGTRLGCLAQLMLSSILFLGMITWLWHRHRRWGVRVYFLPGPRKRT